MMVDCMRWKRMITIRQQTWLCNLMSVHLYYHIDKIWSSVCHHIFVALLNDEIIFILPILGLLLILIKNNHDKIKPNCHANWHPLKKVDIRNFFFALENYSNGKAKLFYTDDLFKWFRICFIEIKKKRKIELTGGNINTLIWYKRNTVEYDGW